MKTRALFSATAAFVLGIAISPADETSSIQVTETPETLSISRGDAPVLTYQKADVAPPDGVDPIYTRSGFIYPLHAPGGGIVTGIHPDDHYHHLGLWHAWVMSEYDGKEPDFWNLKKQTGRVRFGGESEVTENGFTVRQEQIAFLDGPDSKPTVILEEQLRITVGFVEGANVIDYDLEQTNVTSKPITFPAYRYGGGIAYRGPLGWDKENSDYLTSEGLDRTNSHATRARWVAMHGPAEQADGKLGKDLATVTILCHPENHDAPQRIRTWDKGMVFFNYVPVQETGWEIKPGETVTLRYRLVISDGKPNAKAIDARWNAYADEK